MFERYTEKARRVIFFARYEASMFGSPWIETEHLLLGLLREDKALTYRFLRSPASVESIRKQIEEHTTIGEKVPTSVDLPLSDDCKRVLAYAAEEAERLAHKHVGSEHLLLGLLRQEKCFAAQILMGCGLRLGQVREEFARPAPGPTQAGARPPLLDRLSPYISDLLNQTLPLVGRENELDRLMELLCRFTRKNPVLVGEPGAGKRTIAGGLARRIGDGNVPRPLAEKAVLALDLPPLRVLEKDASWHQRLDRALVEAAADGKIFFLNRIDDQAGGIPPVASIELLERPLVAGKIQCIGTSTRAAFAKLQADGHWLAECFEPIGVASADEETANKVLDGIKGFYETFHNVSYTDDAIAHAVFWAGKYIKKRCLPGSAVDVIDQAGAAAQLERGSLPGEVAEVQQRIRFLSKQMEATVANHEFEKARSYSDEQRKEYENLRQLREKYKLDKPDNPAFKISREDIERAARKLVPNPDSGSAT